LKNNEKITLEEESSWERGKMVGGEGKIFITFNNADSKKGIWAILHWGKRKSGVVKKLEIENKLATSSSCR